MKYGKQKASSKDTNKSPSKNWGTCRPGKDRRKRLQRAAQLTEEETHLKEIEQKTQRARYELRQANKRLNEEREKKKAAEREHALANNMPLPEGKKGKKGKPEREKKQAEQTLLAAHARGEQLPAATAQPTPRTVYSYPPVG